MSVGGVMPTEELDLFFPKPKAFYSLFSLGGRKYGFLGGCCSGGLAPGSEWHCLLPPSVPALHAARSSAVGSLFESVFCHVLLPFCSSFVRAGSCLAVHKLIILAFWLCDPLLDSHVCQACLREFSPTDTGCIRCQEQLRLWKHHWTGQATYSCRKWHN